MPVTLSYVLTKLPNCKNQRVSVQGVWGIGYGTESCACAKSIRQVDAGLSHPNPPRPRTNMQRPRYCSYHRDKAICGHLSLKEVS